MADIQAARTLTSDSREERRIEVSVVEDMTVIRLSSWVDGLGWTCLKTLEIEPELVDELHRSLAAARCKVKSESDSDRSSNVISFPKID